MKLFLRSKFIFRMLLLTGMILVAVLRAYKENNIMFLTVTTTTTILLSAFLDFILLKSKDIVEFDNICVFPKNIFSSFNQLLIENLISFKLFFFVITPLMTWFVVKDNVENYFILHFLILLSCSLQIFHISIAHLIKRRSVQYYQIILVFFHLSLAAIVVLPFAYPSVFIIVKNILKKINLASFCFILGISYILSFLIFRYSVRKQKIQRVSTKLHLEKLNEKYNKC